MSTGNKRTGAAHRRYTRLTGLLNGTRDDRRYWRPGRSDTAAQAEDDYFRFANRNHADR
jgi:hypothetical protein